MNTRRGEGMLEFHPHFVIRPNLGGRVVTSKHRLHFTTKEITWYSSLMMMMMIIHSLKTCPRAA